jgi:hypothetical protein
VRDAAVKVGITATIQWLIKHWDEIVRWISERVQDLT